MESDLPDGLPTVAPSSVGSYPYDSQSDPHVSDYTDHASFYGQYFLQQSLTETFNGTNFRQQSQEGSHSHTLGVNHGDGYQQYASYYEQPPAAASWASPRAYTSQFNAFSSQPSSDTSSPSAVVDYRPVMWTQAPPDLAQGPSNQRSLLRLAMEERRRPPPRGMIDDHAFEFQEGGYGGASTSHPTYMNPFQFDGLPAASSLSPSSAGLLPDDSTLSRSNTAPLSECGDHRDLSSPRGVPKSVPQTPGTTTATKEQEPYAQLIYRAFMSHPRHAMTLQEIYQWFRDNTDKDNGLGKGWQNSIRHNLSMNRAFQKLEKKLDGSSDGGQTDAASSKDSKKSSEWYLADWAIDEGVQSTTRYRKGNSSRRTGSGRQQHHPQTPGGSNARRSAGRQGGVAASRTKESLRRKQVQGTTQRAATATSVPANGLDVVDLNGGGGAFGALHAVSVSMDDQNRHASRSSAAAAGDVGPQTLESSYLGRSGGGVDDTAAIRYMSDVKMESDDEPITPEGGNVLTMRDAAINAYTYEAPPQALIEQQSAYTLDDVVGLYGGGSSSSNNSQGPPLFAGPDEVAENLRFWSGYPSSTTCVWMNTDNMGSGEREY